MRLLQVLGTNDSDDDALAALELHRGLGRVGIEVRTLALAPGRTLGPASVLPVMSPSVRSLAAVTQLRREQRWADVLLLRGASSARAAGLVPKRDAASMVLHLVDEARAWQDAPVPTRVHRLARRGITIVVSSAADRGVGQVLGLTPEEVMVVPYGVDVAGSSSSAGHDGRRVAARTALGIDVDVRVVLICGDGPEARSMSDAVERSDAVSLHDPMDLAARTAGGDGRRRIRFGNEGRAVPVARHDGVVDAVELGIAAADLVAAPDTGRSGPSYRLLRGAAAGLAIVGHRDGSSAGLIDGSTAFDDLDAALSASAQEVRRRGSAAAARVAEQYALDDVTERWTEVLGRLHRQGMAPSPGAERP